MDDDTFLHPCFHLPHQVNLSSSTYSNKLIVFRIIGAKCKKEAMGYATYGEFALGFYNEVVVHLPFVSSVHNLWRAKQLYDLNYGLSNFRQGFFFSLFCR